jgi:hypothetical protein
VLPKPKKPFTSVVQNDDLSAFSALEVQTIILRTLRGVHLAPLLVLSDRIVESYKPAAARTGYRLRGRA